MRRRLTPAAVALALLAAGCGADYSDADRAFADLHCMNVEGLDRDGSRAFDGCVEENLPEAARYNECLGDDFSDLDPGDEAQAIIDRCVDEVRWAPTTVD